MKQNYHSNATTNVHLRQKIQKSNLTNIDLSLRYGVSTKTIFKWRHRTEFKDRSSRPNKITYALNELNSTIAIELRVLTWWSLDELSEIINPEFPGSVRSSIYRTWRREGINNVPQKERKRLKNLKNTTLDSFILMLPISLR